MSAVAVAPVPGTAAGTRTGRVAFRSASRPVASRESAQPPLTVRPRATDDDAVELVAGEPVDPSSFAEAIYVNVIEPPVGPVLGATRVNVSGAGYMMVDGAMRCRFGGVVVEASFVSETMLSCEAPPAERLGPTTLELTLNDQDYIPVSPLYLPYISPISHYISLYLHISPRTTCPRGRSSTTRPA